MKKLGLVLVLAALCVIRVGARSTELCAWWEGEDLPGLCNDWGGWESGPCGPQNEAITCIQADISVAATENCSVLVYANDHSYACSWLCELHQEGPYPVSYDLWVTIGDPGWAFCGCGYVAGASSPEAPQPSR